VREAALIAVCALAAGCGRREPPPAAATHAESADAHVADEEPRAGAVAIVPIPVMPPSPHAAARARLHLSLRSTPAGAVASIDGRVVGPTPARWELDDDGRVHDFAFVAPGYETWRLKFSPSQNGVVHATLLLMREADAGTN
jgi:hypothetical protein